MADAIQREAAGDFFAAARWALRYRLGELWNLPAATITSSDVRARTDGDGNDLRRVFELADQLAYSTERFPSADLAYWQLIVTRELRRLE